MYVLENVESLQPFITKQKQYSTHQMTNKADVFIIFWKQY